MTEGNMGVMPVYDMARNNTNGYNDGWLGGGGIWALFILMFMCGGWGFNRGGWGNNGALDAINGVTNEFLYTNLNSTIDRGFFFIQTLTAQSTAASTRLPTSSSTRKRISGRRSPGFPCSWRKTALTLSSAVVKQIATSTA